MTDKYEFFQVEGIVVGWLNTSDDENDCIMENDVAIVQTDGMVCYVRWLGNDWQQIDPPPTTEYTSGRESATVEQQAAIGTRIRFNTNLSEQAEYTKLARGQE